MGPTMQLLRSARAPDANGETSAGFPDGTGEHRKGRPREAPNRPIVTKEP
jgi:hypothetical protein